MSAEYMTSLGDLEQFGKLFKGETFKGLHYCRVAMIGRSNVGKSTLINSLVDSKIADVSKQPGKTRKINFFNWDNEIIIADMPGYGFAKRSKKEQHKWEEIIRFYLTNDEGLKIALILLDARHGPTSLDEQALDFLIRNKIFFLPVFTKYDMLRNQSQRAKRNNEVRNVLANLDCDANPFWISSHKKVGTLQLKQKVKDLCKKN